MTRGLRNNNPGNIRLSNVKYKGEIPSTDPSFKQFKTIDWGYRAIFVLLDSYHRKGFDTIEKMINRYAPPVENQTNKYIDFVAKTVNISPFERIDLQKKATFVALVSAISKMENGLDADFTAIEGGWKLYL